MAAALALARRGRGRTGSNPNVGCLLLQGSRVVGRGWTQDGGRPHAEAMALTEAGSRAQGAIAYVTLEPCAHESRRGPACADSLIAAGIARCVVAMADPDERTAGKGLARLKAAGVETVSGVLEAEARLELAGFVGRLATGRAELTLKLALSLDGRLAMADGRSQWITGEAARLYAHQLRAEADMVLVGGGTLRADRPRLDNRLPGSHAPQPLKAVLTSGPVPEGFLAFCDLQALEHFARQEGLNRILCEGGGGLASALLTMNRVDRLLLLRAPILIGEGIGLEGLHPATLAETHGVWRLEERRPLGADLLERYRLM
ncbi:bifunctional diaminohydroxyphosphoribosylaminopyrimidine deaminase/5-amino-6-(5-phosphoribosylamino)uracil reductase RibD [Sandaracinobacter sp. RS1-74]|nr:bifunctional diaminohydroxyphosphoribosylaminopyrimidine deaminase/5-amino-6-(5-phosphoribosylamino)uracil reductase RibD [Sandaracinobacteroides sayramensis]MCG2839660.1 bifunctional diaminohydroxyphosphoribosylaminopyrimidine deaminase/5-amino-6-(5-phosphoribosylamino)uracil reductase RibD [Sandaracinobacteroides sayramensis]